MPIPLSIENDDTDRRLRVTLFTPKDEDRGTGLIEPETFEQLILPALPGYYFKVEME